MNLNDIPHEQTDGFPTGVSEFSTDTDNEMRAFLAGLNYANDIDVEHGEYFERDFNFVVRIKVGDFGEDE